MVSPSTKEVTFILQAVLKEAWNISEKGWQRTGVSFSLLTLRDGKHDLKKNSYALLQTTSILKA